MKNLSLILLLFCISLFVHAQHKGIEAIAAYQMAEESFDTKNHEAALQHINTTKTILGTANSKILYLEVQILEELSHLNPDYLKNLKSAIHAFEQAPDIDQFSQEKRVEVAKIKMDLENKIIVLKKEEERKVAIQKQYEQMIYRLASELPKTQLSVSNFLSNIPITWAEMRVKRIGSHTIVGKLTEKRINKIIKHGSAIFYSYYYQTPPYQYSLINLETDKKDRIKKYGAQQSIKQYSKNQKLADRKVTVEEICQFLHISAQMWEDFTTGDQPLIEYEHDKNFFLVYSSTQDNTKQLHLVIDKNIQKEYHGNYKNDKEFLYFDVFENTF